MTDQFVATFVAFNLVANSCTPADLHSQSVIGEINLLTIMIPGRGRWRCRTCNKNTLTNTLKAFPRT